MNPDTFYETAPTEPDQTLRGEGDGSTAAAFLPTTSPSQDRASPALGRHTWNRKGRTGMLGVKKATKTIYRVLGAR